MMVFMTLSHQRRYPVCRFGPLGITVSGLLVVLTLPDSCCDFEKKTPRSGGQFGEQHPGGKKRPSKEKLYSTISKDPRVDLLAPYTFLSYSNELIDADESYSSDNHCVVNYAAPRNSASKSKVARFIPLLLNSA